MLIKRFRDGIAHPAAAHVAFISQDEGCRDGIDGRAARFIVLADGRDDNGDIFRRGSPAAQELECHERSCLGMAGAVDTVAQIVHVPGDTGQFYRMVVVSELFQ